MTRMACWVVITTAVTVSSCRGVAPLPEESPTTSRAFVGWQLTQRTYGSIEDTWALAEHGRIASDASALVFEPVYREEEPLLAGLVTARTTCGHKARLQYDGPSSCRTGDPVTVIVWVDGPRDVAHIIHLEATQGAVDVVAVTGADLVAGQQGRYVIQPGIRAHITFTSRVSGRAGLRINVERELELEARGGSPQQKR